MRGSIALIHCLGRARLASHGKRLVATVAEALADRWGEARPSGGVLHLARQEMDQGVLSGARVLWTRALLWLAVIGVFPLSLAQYGPWVVERLAIRLPGDTTTTYFQHSWQGFSWVQTFLFAHGLSTPMLLDGMFWFALAVAPAGIFPALALVWGRGNAWILRAYLAWLAAVTALAATTASQLFGSTPEVFCRGPVCATFTRQTGWGAWVTLGALVLLWVAAAARLFTPRAAFASSTSRLPQTPKHADGVARRTALRRSSAAGFTLGTLIWGFGLILVPWATNNCTGFPLAWTHFVRGACVGLDANNTISFAWPATTVGQGHDFTMFLVFMGLLGIIAIGALWRKGWGGPIVAIIWAALATWLLLQVRAGLATMLEHSTRLTFETSGTWVSGAGPLVTGVGLALVCIAVIGAWIAAISSFSGRGRARDLALVSEDEDPAHEALTAPEP